LGGQNGIPGIFRLTFLSRRAWKTRQRISCPWAFLCKMRKFRGKLETANFWEFHTDNELRVVLSFFVLILSSALRNLILIKSKFVYFPKWPD
jgi:hypothetical protein